MTMWLLAATASAAADPPATTGGLFVEVGGAGLAYSVNAHVMTPPRLAFRVGIGSMPGLFGGTFAMVPIGASYLSRAQGGALEVGGNVTFWPSGSGVVGVVPQVGYTSRARNGLLFKAAFTPHITISTNEETRHDRGVATVLPWVGLSLGFWGPTGRGP